MWNIKKQKYFFFMSRLQTYYHSKQDFHDVDQHTAGKWLIHGPNTARKSVANLDLPCRISKKGMT